MSENNSWSDQWFKAQQQFVDAWSDMAKSSSTSAKTSQSDLWAQSFDLWRQACEGRTQPDVRQAMQKCMDMGREYFAMAEQVSKSLAQGHNPFDAINAWLEQLVKSLQAMSGLPGFNGAGVTDFMKQWFTPNASWQDMVAELTPMHQAFWQMPGMNTSVFNLGEAIDPLGRVLESPGVGYFREPQEKQQKAAQLLLEYNQANFNFNQAFLRVAIESVQGFQQKLAQLGAESMPKSMRELYDLWVAVSESHYAEFALSEEYQSLYGDMVNKLMILKKHYHDMADDFLALLNLPNSREVDTMQQRLQQLRRENHELRKEIREIRSMIGKAARKPAAEPRPATAAKSAPAAKPAAETEPVQAVESEADAKPAPARRKAAAKKSAVKKTAAPKAKIGA